MIYFNDSRDRATDSEFLVDDAVLLGQPVDAVIALTHPTAGHFIIVREKSRYPDLDSTILV